LDVRVGLFGWKAKELSLPSSGWRLHAEGGRETLAILGDSRPQGVDSRPYESFAKLVTN
jgi:hypothetical protein